MCSFRLMSHSLAKICSASVLGMLITAIDSIPTAVWSASSCQKMTRSKHQQSNQRRNIWCNSRYIYGLYSRFRVTNNAVLKYRIWATAAKLRLEIWPYESLKNGFLITKRPSMRKEEMSLTRMEGNQYKKQQNTYNK